jgi:putative transposase
MPWLETVPMDQRAHFIRDHQLGLYTATELCARYGISRKTGYKWLARFEAAGRAGLADRSRAPHTCPHRIPPAVAEVICAARRQHPAWGPAKLLAWLAPRRPDLALPAASTAGDLLARRGLVQRRRRRRREAHPGVVPIATTQPNDLWTADFKGQFRTRDGVYCYPLTVADQHTRYLLACPGCPRPRATGSARSSSGSSARTGCRGPSAPITGYPSPPPACAGLPSSTSGGCGWASSTSASAPPRPSRTPPTSACTGP